MAYIYKEQESYDDINSYIARKIRWIRENNNLTQKDFAERINISRASYKHLWVNLKKY